MCYFGTAEWSINYFSIWEISYYLILQNEKFPHIKQNEVIFTNWSFWLINIGYYNTANYSMFCIENILHLYNDISIIALCLFFSLDTSLDTSPTLIIQAGSDKKQMGHRLKCKMGILAFHHLQFFTVLPQLHDM